jgi:uncharacterized repeat protein (TIGR02543 family)
MVGKSRSGLANDRRAYGCTTRCPPTYAVIYQANGSTSGQAPKDRASYRVGATVTVLGNTGSLVKSGHAFVGWNIVQNGTSETLYSPGDTFIINENTTLYAQWTPTYTVIYEGNGKTGGDVPTDGSSPYIAGSTVTVLANTGSLVKSGTTFAGWNTQGDGNGITYLQGNTFTINEDTPLYAEWRPNYTVTYDPNGSTSGTAPGVSSYAAGSTVTVLGNPGSLAKSGSTFSGWNALPNGSGTNYSQGNTFTINANTTLHAKWTLASIPLPPTALSSVGGDEEAYILFTQVGTVTNYEYSTDDGDTFVAFDPPQIYSPVNIKTLSSDGEISLTNGTTYTVRLKAVNSGASSDPSDPVTVVPTETALLTAGRLIHLDANNSSSYSGSGTAWTNLDSGGAYSATLNGSPTFNATDPNNNYFQFNPGALTGQFAQINQAAAINPVNNNPFTIQIWVRINNVGLQGGNLVSKVFFGGSYDGYALYYLANAGLGLHSNSSLVNYFTSVAGVLSSGWALYTANVQFGNGGGRENKTFVNARQLGLTHTNQSGQVMPNNISQDTGGINSLANFTFPSGFGGEGECDIGEFYYYDTELTPTQIIQNFDATKHRYNV